MKFTRAAKLSALVLLPMSFMAGSAWAQETSNTIQVEVRGDDVAAATTMTSGVRYHLFLTPQARAKGISPESPNVSFKPRVHPALRITSLPSFPLNSGYYPDDVEKVSSTGVTIKNTVSHPIYINCTTTPAACWGAPAPFLTNLGASNMIHLVDQYTGATANARYTVGASVNATMTIYPGTSGVPTLGENDILGVVHAAAKNIGTGYGHIYHVFIPKGVDTCMDEGLCYSPDNPSSFAFCGYHYAVKFADLASTAYYTVEPYQGAVPAPAQNFCTIPFATPNGALVDSMATVLLHELFETITDPDITTGYRAVNSNYGEVGDICEGFILNVTLNGKAYGVQSIYSDKYEACATTP